MRERTRLEQAAVAAHGAGVTWAQFWEHHAADVSAVEPWDNIAYRRLVARLTALVAAGDTDGAVPIDAGFNVPMDWELDDARGG